MPSSPCITIHHASRAFHSTRTGDVCARTRGFSILQEYYGPGQTVLGSGLYVLERGIQLGNVVGDLRINARGIYKVAWGFINARGIYKCSVGIYKCCGGFINIGGE